ncbi:PD-(D/E)XK motif protein, partial [Crocinitomicaceae bacterium]|nr:PD-(D/E)XK motif protein [Crocinitomicaceae bacterium]
KEFPESNQFNNWHGPEGAKIDFIFSNKFGLEVKSRIQPFKDWISISSAEQLDNDLEGQHMAVCDFLQSDTGQTLKRFTSEVMVVLNDHDKVNELIEKFRKVGYDYFADYSNLIKVSLFRQTYYDTKDVAFPVLIKGADLRIDKIKYDININGLKPIEFTDTLANVRSQLAQN